MSDKVKVQPKNELNELVKAYNAAESDQAERLQQIFKLVKKGKGYRHVKFTGDQWVNCWTGPDRLDAKLYINRMQRMIKDVDPGD